jgi:diphthine-ammonia ligase
MKLGVLFSGGKDSTYAAWLARNQGYEVACLISLVSSNKNSYMFHTPSISSTEIQAKTMNIPIILKKTMGKKEEELRDLKNAIKGAINEYKIEGIVTGAVESVYQASRIQKICNELNIECFNPLWQKDQFELLKDLIKNKFKVILTGVFAFPLDEKWLGRQINKKFIEEIKILNQKYKISPAGEGGEFESFVIDCPLFKKSLKIKSYKDIKEGENSWRREVKL